MEYKLWARLIFDSQVLISIIDNNIMPLQYLLPINNGRDWTLSLKKIKSIDWGKDENQRDSGAKQGIFLAAWLS
jgi:hypothetical protein